MESVDDAFSRSFSNTSLPIEENDFLLGEKLAEDSHSIQDEADEVFNAWSKLALEF